MSWENFMPHRDQALEIPLQTTDYGTDEDISASFSLPSVVFRGEELRVRRSGNHQRLVISVQQKRRGALIFAQVGHAWRQSHITKATVHGVEDFHRPYITTTMAKQLAKWRKEDLEGPQAKEDQETEEPEGLEKEPMCRSVLPPRQR